MKMLVAVDENTYSRYALRQAAGLAANTWPDVVMLAIEKKRSYMAEEDLEQGHAHPKTRLLGRYREDFIDAMGDDTGLYASGPVPFAEAEGHVLEGNGSGRKSFFMRVRSGEAARAINAEAKAGDADLVIMGCGQHEGGWGRGSDVPGRVADMVDCSVLVIRENVAPAKVVCCLDHADVSQESLELINQLVTMHNADLEIVGVQKRGELRESVEGKMGEVLDYYLGRGIQAFVRVVDEDSLEAFIEAGGENDLMALWLRHKSPLQRLLPGNRVANLVNHASASVLILR